MSADRFDVVIVRPPAGWEPEDWHDVPQSIETLGRDATQMTRSQAVGRVHGFNTAAMREPADMYAWAIISPAN